MRYQPKDIARALVDIARNSANKHFDAEIDAAVQLFRLHNTGKSLRSFPTLVERELRKAGMDVRATLVTPTGDAGAISKDIARELQKIFDEGTVQLEQRADATMLGGAVLIVNDERFDVSIPGSLARLRQHLKASTLSD